jgi:hypothetical protein
MRANHLAVIFSAKGLPQNTAQACGAIWTQTSRMLLPGLGKYYERFHPAAQPWGVEIPAPFSVVLGRDDPCRFLRLYVQARQFQEKSISFHVGGTLAETGLEKLQAAGDFLICPVTLDGTNKRLEAHILWHMAMAGGMLLPDCGVYYAEQKRSTVEPDFEKAIESAPADYALCMVTLEQGEG